MNETNSNTAAFWRERYFEQVNEVNKLQRFILNIKIEEQNSRFAEKDRSKEKPIRRIGFKTGQ